MNNNNALYRTFIRSCNNWQQFGSARKMTVDRDLDYNTARDRCQEYKNNRTSRQIKKGTMMEFERQ